MTRSSAAGSLLLLAALSVATAGQAANYRTPQEAFAALKKALVKEDWKGACATLTDNSRDQLAGSLAMMPLMIKGFAKFAPEDKQKELLASMKPMQDVLDKHGLTDAVLAKMKEEKAEDKGPEAIKRRLLKLVAPVKDRCAFIADMMKQLQKFTKKGKGHIISPDAELKDVKVEGDTAKGVVVSMKDGAEKRDPLEFRKVGGGWKVELPIEFGKNRPKGPPPPK